MLKRKIAETAMVGAGVFLILTVIFDQPPAQGSGLIGFLLAWAGLSLIGGAGWSMYRAREKAQADAYEELRQRIGKATTGTPRDFAEVLKPPRVQLTAHQLTRVNVARRLGGRPQLSTTGFRRAIESAPTPTNDGAANHWLFYFLMYHPVGDIEQQTTDAIVQGMVIHNNPDGGAFGGAGASGTWTYDSNSVRQTFEVPEGYVALLDNEGRATGEVALKSD